jgi:hypothetical protein
VVFDHGTTIAMQLCVVDVVLKALPSVELVATRQPKRGFWKQQVYKATPTAEAAILKVQVPMIAQMMMNLHCGLV